MFIIQFIRGFCMALADSVPGVSGGTIAFLLGFYDKFIDSIDDLLTGTKEERKDAFVFLIKLGIGWISGFVIAVLILTSVFESHIYYISSLFIGFIIFAIPIVIKEEKKCLGTNKKAIPFVLLGIAVVCAITYFNPVSGGNDGVNLDHLTPGLAVIGLTCSITAQYFAAKAAVGFSTGLRHALFEHIQKLSFSEMDTVGTSTLITRMTSDINQTQNGVNLVLRLFLRSPFIVFGAMIMAFTIDVKAALVFVVTIPLLSVVVFGIMLVSIPLYKKVQSALDKVLGITRENLTGSRVIRAFNKEDDEIADFNNSNDALTKIQLYVGKISALMNPLTYVIINGAVVVLVWTGAIRVNSGYITQGEVVALVNYMSQILVELIKLANLIININKSIACGNRIQAIFELQPSITDHAMTPVAEKKAEHSGEVPEVVFSHVGLTYAGAGEESLTDIDFTVKKGETIGIIGGTGSGKSSVVNLIPRFYDATKGSVQIEGKDVREYSLEELRGKIGMVLQKAVLFKGTIRENMLWGNENATDEDIMQALEVAVRIFPEDSGSE